MNYDTDFRKKIVDFLKEKKLSVNSINLYIGNLQRLNDGPLKNFNFLKNQNEIVEKLQKYKENTKRGYLISIVSVLSMNKDSKAGKKLYDTYYNLLMEKNKTLKEFEKSNVKTESQEKNWDTLDNIKNKQKELSDKVSKFKSNKVLSNLQYNTLLEYVVLSLYVLIPPRRNEYNSMVIIYKTDNRLPDDINYLGFSDRKFVFNKFKNVRKVGSVNMDIPDDLMDVINIYIKFHPLLNGKVLKTTCVPFLVYYDGVEFNKSNSITRILNKIFGKHLSSSLIRHITLSDKYGDVLKDLKSDNNAMSHGISQSLDYIKKD